MYELVDLRDESIEGKFYKQELQRVQLPEVFRIEKIIRTKGNGKHKQHFVKWFGYPKEYNSWIYASQING